ncbi:50S ribosomal protein L34, chloroplastic [Oryza brachyantha]|uniref:Large ribosomal subunit protein bL34c n=1 Tax=Oryza brachyantha TaxID=4533 RepID=J3L510_ORYBR|nr:50S ribosomal protein L34, chloroplastic [Oryza brachyantha]
MALALLSPMATLSLHSGRISAAAIGGGLRPRKAAPMGASATPFLRSSFVSSSSSSTSSASATALSAAVSASLTFTSASSFAGSSLGIEFSYNRVTTGRSRILQIRAGKAALCMTKRSRSRKSLARTHGFRRRMRTTAGRKVLKRRRDKGRKVLCTKTNSPTGKKRMV